MSRVLTTQAHLLSIAPTNRYQPIRPLSDPSTSTSTSSEEKKTLGGMPRPTAASSSNQRAGSIVLLRDTQAGKEGDEGEFLELDKALWPPGAQPAPSGEEADTGTAAGNEAEGTVDEADAVMPQPFQYPFDE
jgi:hypothetical protein